MRLGRRLDGQTSRAIEVSVVEDGRPFIFGACSHHLRSPF